MLRTAVSVFLIVVVVLVLCLPLAALIGLGPAEYWILPAVFLTAIALVTLRRQRLSRQREPH